MAIHGTIAWYVFVCMENKGFHYLKSYSHASKDSFDLFLEAEFDRVKEISKVPAEALRRFHQTAREGKRLRGGLVTLGYELGGHSFNDAIISASHSIELLHAGLLVHDDIMDRDDLRRGLPSIHVQAAEIAESLHLRIDPEHYGISVAMSIGNAAFYLSWRTLMESDFSDTAKVAAAKIYAQYTPNVAYGQILDLTTEGLMTLKEQDILNVYLHKTADYTGVLPLLIGAALAEISDEKVLKALEEYGRAFGWAFQIQDDVLGMFGKEEETGKPVISDLREGKNTLFMLYLSKHGTRPQIEFMKNTLGNPDVTQQDAEKMRQMLQECGAYQYVVDLGWEYVSKAQVQIPVITSNQEHAWILSDLVEYMMERIK